MEAETRVARFAELLEIMMADKGSQAPPPSLFADVKMTLIPTGEAMIAGRAASLWDFVPAMPAGDPNMERPLEVAISADPALAPVGDVFRRLVEALLPAFATILPESTGFAARTRELLAKGTPLRVGKKFELQSVDIVEIDPKRFDLPGPVITAAEFLAGMEGRGNPIALVPLP
jgi:hypothetical protein